MYASLALNELTPFEQHFINPLRPMKMADILQTPFSNASSWMKIYIYISIKMSLKFVPNGPIINIPALV